MHPALSLFLKKILIMALLLVGVFLISFYLWQVPHEAKECDTDRKCVDDAMQWCTHATYTESGLQIRVLGKIEKKECDVKIIPELKPIYGENGYTPNEYVKNDGSEPYYYTCHLSYSFFPLSKPLMSGCGDQYGVGVSTPFRV